MDRLIAVITELQSGDCSHPGLFSLFTNLNPCVAAEVAGAALFEVAFVGLYDDGPVHAERHFYIKVSADD